MNLGTGYRAAIASERMLTAGFARLLIAVSLIEAMWLPLPDRSALMTQHRWAVALLGLLVLVTLLALPVDGGRTQESSSRWQQVGWTLALGGLAAPIVALSGGWASPLVYLFLLTALALDTEAGVPGALLVGMVVLAGGGLAVMLAPQTAQGMPPPDAAGVEVMVVAGLAACVFVLRVVQTRQNSRGARVRHLALTWTSEALALERTRGELLAHVSHELLTPLAAIQASAGMLAEAGAAQAGALVAGQRESVEQRLAGNIQRNAARLSLLVGDLLELARLEESRPVLQCAWHACGYVLRQAVDVLSPLCASRGQTLTWRVASNELLLWGDARRLEQIVINLLANAHKYAGEGAAIEASAWHERRGIRLDVCDDGPGLRADAIPRLFDRYYRCPGSPGQGSGLGLAIAQAQVELHGGRIWAENNAGRGCRFCCWLPDPEPAAVAGNGSTSEDLS